MAKSKAARWGHDVHRYVRFEQEGAKSIRTLWRCVLPNCRHYLVGDLVVGQMTKCNRCGIQEFQMKRGHLDFRKPHCTGCTKGRIANSEIPIETIMNNLDVLLKG